MNILEMKANLHAVLARLDGMDDQHPTAIQTDVEMWDSIFVMLQQAEKAALRQRTQLIRQGAPLIGELTSDDVAVVEEE